MYTVVLSTYMPDTIVHVEITWPPNLKLKIIHKCFLTHIKTELNAVLHCIQLFTNTCEVTMQVKRAIVKAILHKLPIFNALFLQEIITK